MHNSVIICPLIVSDELGYFLGALLLLLFLAFFVYAIWEQSSHEKSPDNYVPPAPKQDSTQREKKIEHVKFLRDKYPDAYNEWFGDGSYLRGLSNQELENRLAISEDEWSKKQIELLEKKRRWDEQIRRLNERTEATRQWKQEQETRQQNERQEAEKTRKFIERASKLCRLYPHAVKEKYGITSVTSYEIAIEILKCPEYLLSNKEKELKVLEERKSFFAIDYEEQRCWFNRQEQFFITIFRWARQKRLPTTEYIVNYVGLNQIGEAAHYSLRVRHLFYKAFCQSEELDYEYFSGLKESRNAVEMVRSGERQLSEVYSTHFLDVINGINEPATVIIFDSGLDARIERYQLEVLIDVLNEQNIPYYYTNQLDSLPNNGCKYYILFGIILDKNKSITICESFLEKWGKYKPLIICYSVFLERGQEFIDSLKAYKEGQMKAAAEVEKKKQEEAEQKRRAEEEKRKQEALKAEQERQKKEAQIRREKYITEAIYSKVENWENLPGIGLKINYILDYYPITVDFEANESEWNGRWIVWNFKNNPEKITWEAHERALSTVVPRFKELLVKSFGENYLKSMTLVCIPASTKALNESRYKDFSERLCKETGMENGYPYTYITHERTAKHEGGEDENVNYSFKDVYFKGKRVILLDDIITKGNSMRIAKTKLDRIGAIVICGLAVGKTRHERRG
jgi:hypothetical protein